MNYYHPMSNAPAPVPFLNPTIRTSVPGGGERVTDAVSELLTQRIVVFAYPFDDFVVTQIIGQLLYLDSQSSSDITMYVNSGGGSVTAGFALYDVMRNLRSDVSTIGMGMCGSMGAFLLSTGAAGKRFAMPGTTIMIHEPSYGTDGKVTHMSCHMKWAEVLKERLIGTMAAHSDCDYDWLAEQMENDNFLSAEEALEFGLIDGIIPPPDGKPQIIIAKPSPEKTTTGRKRRSSNADSLKLE